MTRRFPASMLLLVFLAGAPPLLAHHGNASYENKTVTIKGKVTKWLTDENGKVAHWVCENNAPSTLVNFGFTANTFKSGDEVTVVMSAVAKNGTPVGRITKIILADGYVMNCEVR